MGEVEVPPAAVDAVLTHRWGELDIPPAAHGVHNYYGACAVCQEDVPAVLAVRAIHPSPLGFEVEHSGGFVTVDPALAEAVAERLDREDPLPCPHNSDWLEIASLGQAPGSHWLCADCGERRRGERP